MTPCSERLLDWAKKIVDCQKQQNYFPQRFWDQALAELKDPSRRDDLYALYEGEDNSWETDDEELNSEAWDLIESAADQVNLDGDDEIKYGV